MCMEDIRLGRKTYTAFRAVTASPGADTQIIGPSEKRIAIRIGINSSNLEVAPTVAGQATTAGFFLNTTKPDFEIDLARYGSIVQQAWSARSTGGPTIAIMETFLDDK